MIHYEINDGIPPGVPITTSQFVAAVQQLAQTWMSADPSVRLVDDGLTTAQPVNFNDVVGFTPVATGYANIPLTFSSDGKTITAFDIQLASNATWAYAPCDGASTPCSAYAGTGVDLGAILAHSWGHVLGLADFGAARDHLLTDYGGIATGPDCGPAGPVCRFAATLGLGDILGARYLYPTSLAMPTIYDDQ